jgi:cyclohexanecarboxylate-CoA ligase
MVPSASTRSEPSEDGGGSGVILRDGVIDRYSTLPDGSSQTFWGLIEWRSQLSPDALCLVDERGRRMTFAQYHRACEEVAAGLQPLGIGEGSVVSWQLPTRIESLVVSGALSRLGVLQVPIVPIYRQREMSFVLESTTPSHLIVPTGWRGRDHAAEGQELAARLGMELLVIDEELPRGDPGALGPAPVVEAGSEPIRWIYFTSGTTGAPKGARHTDRGLACAAHAEVECLDLGPSDRTTIVFPVAHIGGGLFFMAGLISGHGQILIANFDKGSVEVLQREGVTYAGAGLVAQRTYLEAQRAHPDQPLFPGIRGFPHGGDAKRPHVHDALVSEIGGAGALSGYGMTEFGMIASGTVHDPREKLLYRLGRPCTDNEVRIEATDGSACPPGAEGEILVRGPSLCHGYLDPAQNEIAFTADGFFRTGDVGFLDEDGYLELTGRLKDIIIRKGESISAVEIEDLLHLHPGVAEVAVVGVPDAERGEMACAVVVPVDPGAPPALAELVEFLLEHGLMVQKCPERMELRAELPRDFAAKVKKAQLRQELSVGG